MSTTISTSSIVSPLTPQLLMQRLGFDSCNLEELIRDCEMEAEMLAELFYSKQCKDHLQLRIDLAVEALEKLTESPKPEVARRAAMTLLNIAGISTTPPKPTPTTPTPTQTQIQTQTPATHPSPSPAHPPSLPPNLNLNHHLNPTADTAHPSANDPKPIPETNPNINQNPCNSVLFPLPAQDNNNPSQNHPAAFASAP